MPHYRYLIIGGGMTADAAVQGIREAGGSGDIGIISRETEPPYDRPPLTKGLWKGKPEAKIRRDTEGRGAKIHLARTARSLDLRRKTVVDDQETAYTYDKLLLATGGTPRRLPFGGDRIIYYRTLEDYRRLRSLAERGRRFAVIGGGFIGWEIAAALRMNGLDVVMLFPEEYIGRRIYPADLGRFLTAYYREKGVEVLSEETVTGLTEREGRVVLTTRGPEAGAGREIAVDGVVAGIGIEPDVALIEGTEIRIENGIAVDEFLRAGRLDVFAAGDVASFPSRALARRIRVEHEDNANMMGRHAGRAMAGSPGPYRHIPFFYSDLFDLGYEAVGDLDARFTTVADWKEPYREGVVYYLRNGRVRGVLLWNVWHRVDAARELIISPGTVRPEDLKGRLRSAA